MGLRMAGEGRAVVREGGDVMGLMHKGEERVAGETHLGKQQVGE